MKSSSFLAALVANVSLWIALAVRADGALRTVFTIMVLAALTTGHAAEAAEITSELGRFGEVAMWLIIRTPETRLEADPFEALGGEVQFAAMSDPKLVPHGGRPLEIPGTKPGETLRIGEGVWEGVRMTLPDKRAVDLVSASTTVSIDGRAISCFFRAAE